jgi:hypothetical protein
VVTASKPLARTNGEGLRGREKPGAAFLAEEILDFAARTACVARLRSAPLIDSRWTGNLSLFRSGWGIGLGEFSQRDVAASYPLRMEAIRKNLMAGIERSGHGRGRRAELLG